MVLAQIRVIILLACGHHDRLNLSENGELAALGLGTTRNSMKGSLVEAPK
jgi:hypothetical protein